jgi:hypothetical protein
MKDRIVQERLEITIGKASCKISRPPEGSDHQRPTGEFVAEPETRSVGEFMSWPW